VGNSYGHTGAEGPYALRERAIMSEKKAYVSVLGGYTKLYYRPEDLEQCENCKGYVTKIVGFSNMAGHQAFACFDTPGSAAYEFMHAPLPKLSSEPIKYEIAGES
jgi:hypothetical protein